MEETTISVSTTTKEQSKCCSKSACHKQETQTNSKEELITHKEQSNCNKPEIKTDSKEESTTPKEKSKCCKKDNCHQQETQANTKEESATSHEQSKCCKKDACTKQEIQTTTKEEITIPKEQSKCCSKDTCHKKETQPSPKEESITPKEKSKCCSKDNCHKQEMQTTIKEETITPKEQSKCCSKGACHKQEIKNNGKEYVSSVDTNSQNSKKLVFKIEGMCCASEVNVLKEVLNPLIQGKDAILSFDVINAKVIIECKSSTLPSKEEVAKAVAKTGMKAELWTDHVKDSKNKTFWEKNGRKIMNIISAIGLVVGFIIEATQNGIGSTIGDMDAEEDERPDFPHAGTIVFYCICIVAGAWFILPKAILAIRRLRPNTKLLTVIATAGAIGINEWFEAAVSMYLFSAAELLEAWNMERARKSIRLLMELAPSTAQVVSADGSVTEQSVEQVPIGATLLIKPGEKIPMDSELISGFASINQAPITGESLPVQKETGDPLFAGTINGDVAIQCKVTKAANDSTLASIIRKVEEAQSNRAKSDQWIERFALYYVPIMMLASLIVAIIPPLVSDESWYPWIKKGLELLVISCPCSLIISTPVSIVAGITAAARSGVLIKGGIHLENSAHIKAFAMDKTGTITTGEPVVHSILPLEGYTYNEILKLAMALEVHSDHPLARAIQRKAKADRITFQSAEEFRIFKGKGAEGIIQGKLYWIGSHRYVHEKVGDKESPALHQKMQELENAGQSIVALGHEYEICGLIGIADSVRPQSKIAIQAMKKAGVQRVVMLTGDSKGAAKVIADAVNIDEYKAELLPEDKVKQVEELVKKYKNVAMVGDGVNDAPAMAAARLGIAMGVAGSDTAIETADIALMADDLGKLAWLIKHSRRTLNIIKQNVIFSLLIKAVFVGLTFGNKSSLWLAIVADMGATFLVVSNSLRLVGSKNKEKTGKLDIDLNQTSDTPMKPLPKASLIYQSKEVEVSSPYTKKNSDDLENGKSASEENKGSVKEEKKPCGGCRSHSHKK